MHGMLCGKPLSCIAACLHAILWLVFKHKGTRQSHNQKFATCLCSQNNALSCTDGASSTCGDCTGQYDLVVSEEAVLYSIFSPSSLCVPLSVNN